jgi:uncharacterized membrane protein YgcG
MNMTAIRSLILATSIAALLAPAARAGHEIESDGKGPLCGGTSVREWFPDEPRGMVTVGGQFSSHLNGAYLDSITGLWAPQQRDAFLFLNSRYHYEDNGEFISSTGLGFRKLLPAQEVILGANAYWDSLHGKDGSDFDQLGLGAEILTHWVDARFNYYLPEDGQTQISHHTEHSSSRNTGPGFVRTSSSKQGFETREAALEGFNAEIGVLLPFCKTTEIRIYGGYYHYDNPFGGDFEGFKGRLEARLLPGVIADVEYWDDSALMGGHWTAGVRASVPFSIYNLVTGRNPFEGIADSFTPREREFKERMGDMVERSHRVQTTASGDLPTGSSSTTETTFVQQPRSFSGGGGRSGGGGGGPLE